ncbi:MAG: hypothetical protein ACTSVM_01735 [Candidatus Ranarchaeia archaeon]
MATIPAPVCTLKFIGKIKKTIKRKNNKKFSRLEALLKNENIRSNYTRDEIEGALKYSDTFDREEKRRRQEDRRRLVVKWIGGFFAIVGINGSFFILAHLSGVTGLLFDEWKLWPTLAGFIFIALWVGYGSLLYITFCWLSDKTGFYFWIEDWIEAWDSWDAQDSHNIPKFKEFPRRERRALVRDLEKVLNVISDGLTDLEDEACDNDDEELSASLESINQLILSLSFVSSSLLQHRASWKAFVLILEETVEGLELELTDIAKCQKKVQLALELASSITALVMSIITDAANRNDAKQTVSLIIQILSTKTK